MIICIVPAVGCETFKDSSSVIVLNQTKQCQDKSECFEEKEINVDRKVTNCFLLPNQAQYLNKDGWQPLSVKTDMIDVLTSRNKTLLKVFTYDLHYLESQVLDLLVYIITVFNSFQWNLIYTPRSWKGLIVKVQFQCNSIGEDKSSNEVHCILIKYTGRSTGTYA